MLRHCYYPLSVRGEVGKLHGNTIVPYRNRGGEPGHTRDETGTFKAKFFLRAHRLLQRFKSFILKLPWRFHSEDFWRAAQVAALLCRARCVESAPKRGLQILSPMVVPGIKSPGSVITGSGPVSNRPDSDSPDSIIPGSANPSSKYQYERKQSSSRRGASVSPEFVAQVYETTQQLKRR